MEFFYMQNNQLPTETLVALEDNSNKAHTKEEKVCVMALTVPLSSRSTKYSSEQS